MSRADDPFGRRALFGPPPPPIGDSGRGAPPGGGSEADEVVRAGQRALFSSLAAPVTAAEPAPAPVPVGRLAGGERRRGRIVVECGSCGGHSALGLLDLARQLLPSVWIPIRRMSRLMRCPKCRRLTWCRLDWLAWLGP